MSGNRALQKLEVDQRVLMKSHLEVELNEFLQEQVDSGVFEGVDEEDKARFIGSFFRWVRNLFNEKKTPELPSGIKSSLDEQKVESPQAAKIGKPIPAKKPQPVKKEQKKVASLELTGSPLSDETKLQERAQIFSEPLPAVENEVGADVAKLE